MRAPTTPITQRDILFRLLIEFRFPFHENMPECPRLLDGGASHFCVGREMFPVVNTSHIRIIQWIGYMLEAIFQTDCSLLADGDGELNAESYLDKTYNRGISQPGSFVYVQM